MNKITDDNTIRKNAFYRGMNKVDEFDRQHGTQLGPRVRRELCHKLGYIRIVDIDGKDVEIPTPRSRQALHARQIGNVTHTETERRAIEQTFKAYIGVTDIWGLE